jgi:hypothetical protein
VSTDDKASLDERLKRLGIASDVQRLMAAGIDRLPMSEPTKSSLTSKSATAVVVVGETGVALAKGAVTAAKDGVEEFQRTLHEQSAPQPAPQPTEPVDEPVDADADADLDVTTRLERLSELHRSGHLDDDEYRAAKAKVLAGS